MVRIWAMDKPEIRKAYVFGSQAKGTSGPGSDLDIAIVLSDAAQGERLAIWIAEKSNWQSELQLLLPDEKVDLDLGDADLSDSIVAPAISSHGILIFDRTIVGNSHVRL